MAKIIFFLIAVALSVNSAKAASTPWIDSAGGRMRILLQTNNAHSLEQKGTIEIDLKPLWKTYWRYPGSSGMAPLLNIEHAKYAEFLFPMPEDISTNGQFTIGYHGHILLPFKFKMSGENNEQAIPINGTAMIGLCQSLCIPVQIPFHFFPDVQMAADFQSDAIIDLAFSQLPTKPTDAFHIETMRISGDKLTVKVIHPASELPLKLFLDGGETELGKAEITSQSGTITEYSAAIFNSPKAQKFKVNYTALSGKQSISGNFCVRRPKKGD